MQTNKPLFPVRKGTIVQGFGANAEFYAKRFPSLGDGGHQGVDIISFHGDDILLTKDLNIYKVADWITLGIEGVAHGYGFNGITPPDENGICEEYICWHMMSNLKVKAGQFYKQGEVAGREGQSGDVYSNGVRVPDNKKGKPPYPGTHLHFGKRIVQKTNNPRPGDVFLTNRDKTPYVDKDGYMYRVMNYDNGHQGFVDPFENGYMTFDEYVAGKLIDVANETVKIIPTIQDPVVRENTSNWLMDLITQLIAYLKGRT